MLLWGLLIVLLAVAVFGEGPAQSVSRRQLRELEDPSDAGPCTRSASTTAPSLPAIVVVSASPDQVCTTNILPLSLRRSLRIIEDYLFTYMI